MGTSIGKRNARRNMGQHMFVDPALGDRAYKRAAYQRYLKKYLRTVRGVDDAVARLLQYLEDEGELDNTVVVYTSDQGFMLGEHDYIDKRWMYEESLRIPLLVRHPPTVAAGSRSRAIVNNTDLAPTLLAFAGVAAPDFMQGRSLSPLLRGETPADWRKATYYRYWMHMAHHDNPRITASAPKIQADLFLRAAARRARRSGRRNPTPDGNFTICARTLTS